ncbi:MAG: PAS domain S-box protein [Acidobacteria bacterium]|jgi:PAS domain S-box-containing protein|nr:PAS domain S-box protein [Acidobacteriota bacterium]
MIQRRFKNALVVGLGLALASLGVYNIVLKATWSLMDDGVFWEAAPQGLVASRIDPGGPGSEAGVRAGDILLAVDGQEALSRSDLEATLATRRSGEQITYSLLRADERRTLDVTVRPLPPGNVAAFYYLSLVGFFSLIVGTVVMLRRPADRVSLHFYSVCVLFFLAYSISYSGKLTLPDWTLFWADFLARLFLPVVFLHFCLIFPERRLRAQRLWLVPAIYMPALVLAGAAAMSHALGMSGEETGALWSIVGAIDRIQPLYFAAFFAMAFAVLVDAYRRTRSLTARRQIKWLVWGTGGGAVPFLAFYALPFALGRDPGMAMELAGYVPLALIPLSLAYAVVKHRLMDVELIVRRALGFVIAVAILVGGALLTVELSNVLWEEPHNAVIALLSALVAVLLFTPVKSRLQEALERLFYRERYSSRKALVRLSEDLNADLDLERTSDRLLQGVAAALGLREMALFLPAPDGGFVPFRARGVPRTAEARLADQGLISRLQAGEAVDVESRPDDHPTLARLGLGWLFPCRVKGDVIGVLGVGRKDGLDPLNSEEVDTLKTVAAHAATAIMNGRLYRSLRSKAEELRELKDYSENILESLDSGIVVLGLDGEIKSWNRAMESLYGRKREEVLGRPLGEVLPDTFMKALQGTLGLGDQGEIGHIYKLHLQATDGRSLMVNISIAPFQEGPAERCGTILILDDVTARARLEEQLQHTEKMASVGLLAAGVAHEVNTPLAGISSYTQLLRGQMNEPEARGQLLDKIEKQSFRAAKIINSLLNFSRSSGTGPEQVDVNKALVDVLSLVEHQLSGSRIRVRRELASDLPPVRGNENRIQQVFFNLILNARDAMPRGGWLTLVTYADTDTVVVEVKDTGHGIRREHVRRIYDPFFTTKGIGRGTGLGLSVSYGIVQEIGGAIFVESTPGQGTQFQVALPALVVSEAAQQG